MFESRQSLIHVVNGVSMHCSWLKEYLADNISIPVSYYLRVAYNGALFPK